MTTQQPTALTPPEISISNLSLWRGCLRICHKLNLVAAAGTIVQLTGANGSGKTSLLRSIAGLAEPDEGEITWRGTALSGYESDYASELVYVGHQAGLDKALTPVENLMFYLGLKQTQGQAVTQALAYFRVDALADTVCGHLSEGQCRRVALARLLTEPALVWILDEPAATLDEAGVGLLETMLNEHSKQGGIAFISTHRPLAFKGRAIQCLNLERSE